MKGRKLLISILTGLCVCFTSMAILSACGEKHTHAYTSEVTKEATCTEAGITTYTCSCNDTYTEEIPALGHNEVTHRGKASTCTEKGWNAYETCTRCDYTTYEEILALGHNRVQHSGQAATCTEIGWKTYETCTRCDYTTYKEIPALKHNKIQHSAQEATCTEKGWQAYETCTRCNYTTYAEIPAKGHTYTEQNTDEKYLLHKATPESPAIYHYSCLCGAKGEKTFLHGEAVYVPTVSVTLHTQECVINAGESYGVTVEIIPANASNKTLTWTTDNPTVATVVGGVVTAHAEGTATITVTTADGISASCLIHAIIPVNSITIDQTEAEIYIGQPFALTATVLPANATYKTLLWTSSDETVATVNENGVITATKIGATSITVTVDGKTATCALTVKAGEIEFTLTEDSSFYVVTGYTGYEKNVEIPNLHDGLRIIRIAEQAFRENTYIETLIMPNTIQTVDAYAFYGCTSLQSVIIPESVKDLNEYTFANCTNLETVTLNYKITKIGAHAFESCSKLKEIIFLTNGTINLEVIDEYAFANCISLANFHAIEVLPKLKTVGAYAFSKCTALELVSLPMSLETIENHAFENCTGLKLLYVGNPEAEPTEAKATIGAYAFTHCTALQYAQLTSIVQVIANNAFEYCSALETVAFAEGLTTIQDKAFDYCTGLKILTFPNSLTTIGNMAFRHAESLKYIQFPTQLTTIGNASFQYCITLQEVTLPENITKLGNSAFSFCEGLTTLSVLGDVTQWGNSTFYECQKLTNIYIASAYSHYAEEENYVFYNAGIAGDGITLTIGKTAIIPEGLFIPVERVENFPKITKIIVEDGATTVNAFLYYNYLPYLTEITMPDSVTSIPYGIFNNCPWWTAQEKGVVYIDNVFYGYKCDCAYCTPSEIVVENYVDSDCLNDGSYDNVVTCTICNYEVLRETIVIPAKGHDYIPHEAQAVTCLKIGWEAYNTCSRCDYNEYVEIPALGHDYIAHEAQAVTCTEVGWEVYNTCSRCDYNEYVEIPALGHDYVAHEAQAVTCLEIGWEAYNTCSRCDYNEYVEIPALGHSPLDAVVENFADSDCTNDGSQDNVIYCDACKEELFRETVVILAKGHNFSNPVVENLVDSDCVNTGSYDHVGYCTRCQQQARQMLIIPAKGHKLEETVQNYTTENATNYPFSVSGNQITSTNTTDSSSATYTITAQRAFTLELQYKVSSESNYDYLTIKHNSTEKKKVSGTSTTSFTTLTISMQSGDKVTITYSKDSSQKSGSDCAWVKIITPAILIDLIDTTEENIERLASCAKDTLCAVCSTFISKKIAHDYISHEAKTVTCLEIGWDEYNTCSRCDYNSYKEIPKQHNATGNNGYCLGCNMPESTPGLSYSKNTDGTYTVTGIGSCTATDIVIGFYNGKDITSINTNAFRDYSNLMSLTVAENIAEYKTIDGNLYTKDGTTLIQYAIGKTATEFTIPANVTGINEYAFSSCTNLTKIIVPNSVTSIGAGAFYGCNNLTEIALPFIGANKSATSFNSVFGYIFGYTKTYSSSPIPGAIYQYYIPERSYYYYIPSSLTKVILTGGEIKGNAFYNCSSLTSVVIGDGVTSIGNYAFRYCSSLTSVVIGDGVTSIGNYAFGDCSSLTSVVIPDRVTSIGDYAFYKCSSLTSITIPDSVTSIGDYAFYNCSRLTSITIPDSVTSIGVYAFGSCDCLTSVVIGNSVTSIGDSAFRECDSLMNIILPDSLTSIGAAVFYRCDSLISVVIGCSVTSIGGSAFWECYSLTSLYYKGTSSDWLKIDKGSYVCFSDDLCYYSEIKPATTYDSYWRYVDGVPTKW